MPRCAATCFPVWHDCATVLTGELRVKQVFEEMREHEVERDTVTYTALIDACARGHRRQDALEVFAAMRAEGVPPNTVLPLCDVAVFTMTVHKSLYLLSS